MKKSLWWGYRHVNGSYQVRRYYDLKGIQEADESEFTVYTKGPFAAGNREDALLILKRLG